MSASGFQSAILAHARRVLGACPRPWTYARVDAVEQAGEPRVAPEQIEVLLEAAAPVQILVALLILKGRDAFDERDG